MQIRELLEKYQREVVPEHSPRTQKDYAWHIARLIEHFGHLEVDELKPKDVGMFLSVPNGKISRNRSIAVLSAAYSQAVGRWWLAELNPCLKVLRNPSKPRTRYITNAEFEAMRSVCPPMVQVAMDLAYLTGQRQGDLLKLTRENEYKEGVFFQQGKTGKKLIVGLTDRLKEVMVRSRHMKIPGRFYVIRNLAGEPYTSEGFRAVWQRYMRIALKRGLIKSRFTFHDIRAKCVSDTKDLQDAMKRAGHSNMNMTRQVYDRSVRVVPALF